VAARRQAGEKAEEAGRKSLEGEVLWAVLSRDVWTAEQLGQGDRHC